MSFFINLDKTRVSYIIGIYESSIYKYSDLGNCRHFARGMDIHA